MLYIKTPRLILRDYIETDLAESFRLRSDEKTMYYLPDLKISIIDEMKSELADTLADINSQSRQLHFFNILEAETMATVGSIGYHQTDITNKGKTVHLGYFNYPKFWGKGYTTEALTALLDFAFNEDNVSLITTGCLKENIGSERVMQKCGFRKVRELNNGILHDGILKTRLEYQLSKNDYINR